MVSAALGCLLIVTSCQAGSASESPNQPDARSSHIVLITDAPAAPVDALQAEVDRVVDGDTIIVNIGDRTETVRLLGIDTPEKAGGPRPAECFGAQASRFAHELLPSGTAVLLSRDGETRDQYGRLLAFVHRASDGLFINLAMVELGYASALFFAPNKSLEPVFTSAADRARREWIGFWPACGAVDITLQSHG